MPSAKSTPLKKRKTSRRKTVSKKNSKRKESKKVKRGRSKSRSPRRVTKFNDCKQLMLDDVLKNHRNQESINRELKKMMQDLAYSKNISIDDTTLLVEILTDKEHPEYDSEMGIRYEFLNSLKNVLTVGLLPSESREVETVSETMTEESVGEKEESEPNTEEEEEETEPEPKKKRKKKKRQ